ncbi:SDR family NAD(P)-dependent oxidoreductase [Gluconobacter kanchanaburiensis]|uniref:Short-chain dehydrogenase n=1 Tax=Gluconobacter kanchanaburiensis NBRC 103587 TaxID=1307948 RepID=A0A511BAL6_9PROT|nr:SDR family NAD(P)-dependent oxidoreductase [Gluconobacter kanchanaburiensis]MBF0863063.1 SDR family NAD(P)-dependent oxidoreductase [Gluconobacter kanchanaburiensis]GBR71452.1 putative short-chain dehydrogenase/reductase SDR [Gluconobacter kanchanaburiensis NBRC 103587]GEK97456.1 short-chain dehydrogenase [Gluconobacter kanchanaburiensis NBRC 103587]
MHVTPEAHPLIVICGYGPGVSHAVAQQWAQSGYRLALVARNSEKLDKAVEQFTAEGIEAHAYSANLADPEAVTRSIVRVEVDLGAISTLHWNAFTYATCNLLEATTVELQSLLDITLHGLLAGVRAALSGLCVQKGEVLVTGGGFGFFDDEVDAFVARIGAMGGAAAKAALHKAVGVLHQKLAADDVYVGEVVINSMVKNTSFEDNASTLLPETVAAMFWDLHIGRKAVSITTI